MADMLNDGQIKCVFVPSIANIAAPTTAELAAGTALECLITADGLDIKVGEATVSIPKLCETSVSEAPGRTTYGMTLTMVRKTVTVEDVAWTVLLRGTTGYLVLRYGVPYATAFAAAQKVQVFPGKAGERQPQKPEQNGATKFMSQWFVSSQPNLDAVVA
jgi:hypothetical protein